MCWTASNARMWTVAVSTAATIRAPCAAELRASLARRDAVPIHALLVGGGDYVAMPSSSPNAVHAFA
jgi:hypothetical protein